MFLYSSDSSDNTAYNYQMKKERLYKQIDKQY